MKYSLLIDYCYFCVFQDVFLMLVVYGVLILRNLDRENLWVGSFFKLIVYVKIVKYMGLVYVLNSQVFKVEVIMCFRFRIGLVFFERLILLIEFL